MAVLCLLAIFSAGAAFKVTDVSARFGDQALVVSAALDLGFTTKVGEAVSKGIPVDVIIDVYLYRTRPIIWDERVQNWVLRRRISYHALSRQYLLSGHRSDPDAVESFASLQSALASMGTMDGVKLPLARTLAEKTGYYLGVRAILDIEALPAPLRPVAYTSLSWRLNSGWTEWSVQH